MAILAQLIDDVVLHKFELSKNETSVGRHPGSDIQIEDASVSGQHACIRLKQNEHFPEYQEIYIEDLNSTNGTFVNEEPVTGMVRLHHNDTVRVAWNRFKLLDPSEADMEQTVHMIKR
jgi:pSer/pThr/pTyr-binding forkhead associated (FHA) protein